MKFADQLIRQLHLVPTWPLRLTVAAAIECEAESSAASLGEVAGIIAQCAREWTRLPQYSCPDSHARYYAARANTVDRFWFEDARWRWKDTFAAWKEERTTPPPPHCLRCDDHGKILLLDPTRIVRCPVCCEASA